MKYLSLPLVWLFIGFIELLKVLPKMLMAADNWFGRHPRIAKFVSAPVEKAIKKAKEMEE